MKQQDLCLLITTAADRQRLAFNLAATCKFEINSIPQVPFGVAHVAVHWFDVSALFRFGCLHFYLKHPGCVDCAIAS